MIVEETFTHFEALLEVAKKFKQQTREKTFFDTAFRIIGRILQQDIGGF